MAKQQQIGKIVLAAHRVSYVNLLEPTQFKDEKPKYNITFLIPYDHEDVDRIEAEMKRIYAAEKESTFKGLPFNSPKIWNPLRDGEEVLEERPDREEYRDMMFIKATSKTQPIVFDSDGQEIEDIGDVYSGCYCRGVIALRAFNSDGKRGFSVYINSVKFIKDGERLGGFTASHDDYEDDEPRRGRSRPAQDEPAPRRRSRPVEDEDDEPAPRRRSRPVEDEDDEPAPRRRSRRDDIEDEPAPRRRSRPVEDEEDEPAPRRRRPVDEDDEPAPRRRRSRRVDDEDDLPF